MVKAVVGFLLSISLVFGFGFGKIEPVNITPVEKAYKPHIQKEGEFLKVQIEMVPEVYLYKKHLKLLANGKELNLEPYLPDFLILHDNEIFEKNLSFKIPLHQLPTGEVNLTLKYQGCNSKGVCYPPQEKSYQINNPKSNLNDPNTSNLSEEESIASRLKNDSLWITLLSFFGFGLLLALTPCVFPMIPILSSLIVGAKNMDTKKAFIYSLVYVLSMSLTYTIAGVLAGLFGANLQAAFQNPIVILLFVLVFIVLALSMFGFYEIGLPASLQTKLSKTSNVAGSRGGLIGIGIMGFLSALIVGPCVAPPLAGALIYIGQTGNAFLGGLALFSMSLGMGVPLILVGVGAGKFMPKPGGWMEAVSKIFGVIMLGVAIWMLERILPPAITLMLWGMLFIGSAIYLRALEQLDKDAPWFEYFKKSLGIILFIYGVFLMVGSVTEGKSVFNPLRVVNCFNPALTQPQEFKKVSSLQELLEKIKEAKKPVMVDVSAKWCTSCKELEEITFSDPQVQAKLKEFEVLKVDVTKNSAEDKEILSHFGVFGPPAILFFDRNGKEIRNLRVVGFKGPKEFVEILQRAKDAY